MKNLILTAVIAVCTMTFAVAQERADVVSSKNFKKTVETLNKTIKSKGMMVVATVDHQNMLKMVGTSIKGATTIEFGKPDMGKMLFTMKPEAGLEMPARFYVFEKSDGKTVVSYYKSNYAKYGADFAKMDEMMNMSYSEITNFIK
ncbi:MAG: DUF302 domain-containing protein [Bacteroidetes bacterium]|nr:DUF302 domain-containing protein [Bacteroidota bacterium]MBU2584265.1 DUF302 domain-containing protein [Bacteroidota bacterium]